MTANTLLQCAALFEEVRAILDSHSLAHFLLFC